MRIPSSVSTAGRLVLALTVVVGSVALLSAPKPAFTKHDKAFYLDPALVDFVRPGLAVKIVSAQIASDGTITATVNVTDPKGLPLDKDGVTTPGAVSLSFIAAFIPSGQQQYVAYTTRPQTSPITNVTAIQASSDSGGTFQKVGDGEYTYTFGTKAPTNFDRNATHTIGVYSSRNLSEFDLGTQYASDTYNFVPSGAAVTVTRDIVTTATCDKCHDQLAFHGGSRRGIKLCVLCHTPQTMDPDTGNTVDMKVMAHKIHMGEELPSVQAGTPYQIIGYRQSVSDYSTVAFPAYGGPRNCQACHDPNSGAEQANAWLTTPSRAACGACHDNVNFDTGENHVDLPQLSDRLCSTCHIPQGDMEFDASIKGAHTIPQLSVTRPGINIKLVKVDNGTAGQAPTVTFTLKDDAGNPIAPASLKTSPGRLALVLAGPTSNYGLANFGPDVTTPGYVSEDATSASCGSDGTCTYTFQHAIPADATGTFAIGAEARRGLVINAGKKNEVDTEYGAINQVTYFSVDGSPVVPRRTVVSIDKCNGCHKFLSLHGENRNQIEMCVLCHNARQTDDPYRSVAQDPTDRTLPPQSVDFVLMIHKIHTGENMKAFDRSYVVVGFRGSHNDFSDVRFPAFSPSGEAGDTRNCDLCHVNGSDELPLPAGLIKVTDPQGLLNPVGYTTAACTACHQSVPAASHALSNTTDKFGEACTVCHGGTADFNVDKVHAQ